MTKSGGLMDLIALAYSALVVYGAVAGGCWLSDVAYRLALPPVMQARREMTRLLFANVIRVRATESDVVFEAVEEDTPAMKEAR